ncbi:DUF1640-domain-containing protein [Hortaea werneckii]|uniref:DUF1640 domain-containing protein n=1 Tax=Hortaea werneckii TaxID=91943 RepID=A0A3M7B3E6_HORWE|nr:DUF1640-domain-containing protein [Hortaea werneckii]KAI6980757.1 DUF1640-domain-containing protein [Hortaea werneckii]KAI7656677.1 DUF1640-domain-containing protein [Hortaea werneckii]RMX92913.1 hypothetical protein D0867_14396 [Hortaea werneckii]RMY34040.1 hypothetical protein D0866_05518 [Hortaea werneckii]
MTTPFASNTIRSAHRSLCTANIIRPAYTSSIIPHHHQPFHTRTTATTAFAQAQWNHRRHTPPRPSPLNRPRPNQQAPGKQPFTTTPRRQKDHHFDTLKFVQRLEAEGFTEAQSAAMMRVLSDVIEESIQNLTRTMVLREDQEKATYTQKVDFAKLRSELLSADSTESSLTRGTHERLTNDLAKLNSRLRDEVQRTQASVRLDLNLEKGRIREEANSQDLKIKETETRIEQECAALRERLEAVKFSTLQWLMGVCTGTAAIILGVWRLLM